ncbi:hypothetical protein TNCV_1968141 [Trichonephila clavipes]|nr:hypothetical protein TNCV_1968141 [Trichonephila clavipes]
MPAYLPRLASEHSFFTLNIYVDIPNLRVNKDNIPLYTNPNIHWTNNGLSFQQLYLLAKALRHPILKWPYTDSMVNRITPVHWSRHLILLDPLCHFYLHVTTASCTD